MHGRHQFYLFASDSLNCCETLLKNSYKIICIWSVRVSHMQIGMIPFSALSLCCKRGSSLQLRVPWTVTSCSCSSSAAGVHVFVFFLLRTCISLAQEDESLPVFPCHLKMRMIFSALCAFLLCKRTISSCMCSTLAADEHIMSCMCVLLL